MTIILYIWTFNSWLDFLWMHSVIVCISGYLQCYATDGAIRMMTITTTVTHYSWPTQYKAICMVLL